MNDATAIICVFRGTPFIHYEKVKVNVLVRNRPAAKPIMKSNRNFVEEKYPV